MMSRRLTPIVILSCAAFIGTATTNGLAQSEVRVEKKVVNGDETIDLWIDGKKIKVDSSDELQEILAKYGIDSEVGEKEIKIRVERDEDDEKHGHHERDADHDAHGKHGEMRQIRVKSPRGEHHLEWNGAGELDLEAIMGELDLGDLVEGGEIDIQMFGEGMDLGDLRFEGFQHDGNIFVFEGADGNDLFEVEVDEADIERRGFLGVYLAEVDEETRATLPIDEGRGIMINDIIEDSPAAKAGLRDGDVIFRMIHNDDEYGIATLEGFTKFIAGLEPGEEIELFVIRDGDDLGFDVEIGKWGGDFAAPDIDERQIRREWGGQVDDADAQIEHMHRMIREMEQQIEEMERMLKQMHRQREGLHRELQRHHDDT